MQSYDYTHRTGVDDISWNRFAQLAATLSEQLATFRVDAVVGIARAGLFPAAVACAACGAICTLFASRGGCRIP